MRLLGDLLKNIINNKNFNDYAQFIEYCLLKDNGLRKESFVMLNSFIYEANKWDSYIKQDFANWLFTLLEQHIQINSILDLPHEQTNSILVHSLKEKLLKPLLKELMILNPRDVRAYRWYGLFLEPHGIEYLNSAFHLGGNEEQQVIKKLINLYIKFVDYSVHEVHFDLYLGDLDEDMDSIRQLEYFAPRLKEVQYRKAVSSKIIYYKHLLEDWIQFKKEKSKGFDKWCADRDKKY